VQVLLLFEQLTPLLELHGEQPLSARKPDTVAHNISKPRLTRDV
jgi:hypothetical protein